MWQALLLIVAAVVISPTDAHGHLTFPASTRHGGSLKTGGSCADAQCRWFSNNVEISVAPSLPNDARTLEVNITGGPEDVYRTFPWRAPGRAPVFGSGCGVAAGGPYAGYPNAGVPPPGIPQGADGLTLPKVSTQFWSRGAEVEVAWAITANHGGGYSYRLCRSSDNISEECFQRNVLRFAGNKSWIIYSNGSRKEFARTTVSVGTHPARSEWARNPIPGCRMCSTYDTCGSPVEPGPPPGKTAWNNWNICSARCDGSHLYKLPSCPAGTSQIPEPVPGLSSFENLTWDWSIMDRVIVPSDLELGDYILSWRWDCEQSRQVWQNCADVSIVDGPAPAPPPTSDDFVV